MSVGNCIYFILLKPLELLFEGIYISANNLIHNPGLSIIILSLSMNILVFPLYRRADMMQEMQRKKEKSIEGWVNHIKKTFKGDERFMMLQAYYRQNDYSPFSSVKGALPLLLEIPFFLSAYHFLSNLSLLDGTSFWIIRDLGKPDALITIGSISINVLPIIMTIVNLISSSIYTKDALLKDKLQLYAIALVFLVFLYPSPAGLTFYWTLNNLFSLVKNIVYNPKDVVKTEGDKRNGRGLFSVSAILMTVLVGLLIPAALINSSVGEFVDVYFYENPLKYLLATLCLSIGTFIVWAGVLYYLLSDKWKRYLSYLFWIGSIVFIVDYMFFGNNKGILSSNLIYETKLSFWAWEYILNILVIIVMVFFGQLLVRKKGKIASSIAIILTIALVVMGVSNIFRIDKKYKSYAEIAANLKQEAEISLSKNGKNVIVLMMDKAASIYLPYMIKEKPELKEKFDGFTYYPNTISFGTSTNTGSPGLYGGYDYIPDEMNRRSDIPLAEKQNEALKVMPVMFSDAGFDVTVCDPTYAGYSWIPDLSIYDDYPEIKSYITKGRFVDSAEESHQSKVNLLNRNMFCYSLMRAMPVPFRLFIYNGGKYNSGTNYEEEISSQHIEGLSKAEGLEKEFMDTYSVLEKLKDITNIKDDSSDNFLMMSNDTTHEPVLLKEPEYIPEKSIDNTEYDKKHSTKTDDKGNIYELDSEKKITHYQVNMASLLKLGEWFDYLRTKGVYDNTRIIIVSDHSHKFGQKGMQLDVDGKEMDVTGFQCLLLVKDFDSTGFEEKGEFMTNADTPGIAMNAIIEEPVNPFTGKTINNDMKHSSELHLNYTSNWVIDENNGNTFLPDDWYTVHDNIFDSSNWEYLGEY